jgi:methionyl-tRNA formyltransferase
MKIVFAGTPEFAAQAMRAIYAAGHEIVLVLTQPDRRAGRGMHLQASPVKEFAIQHKIPVLQPETLRRTGTDSEKLAQAQAAYEHLSSMEFDAMVVVAYGLILPQEILDISGKPGRHGSFNIHASLLPRWRGAAPIQRAIESGDLKTGVCIMQMDVGLDTGDTVLVSELEIANNETSASLHDRLAQLGSKLIVDVLNQLQQGEEFKRLPQAKEGITYAEKILKSESVIDWTLSAKEVDQRIRAFNPFPGASSRLNGTVMKFWNSRLAIDQAMGLTGKPGEVLGFSNDGVYIQCATGVVEVLEMQKPGGKKIDAKTCIQSIGEQQLHFQPKD